jgi:hypothetical protein
VHYHHTIVPIHHREKYFVESSETHGQANEPIRRHAETPAFSRGAA